MFNLDEVLKAVSAESVVGNHNGYFSGVSIDSRTIKKGDIFICIKGERFDGHDFIPEAISKGASCIISSRDKAVTSGTKITSSLVLVKNTISALSDLAYYHRKRFGIPIIAITGSNGKTTTKEMLASLLGSKYKVLKNEGTQNNIIGLSLSLLRLSAGHDIAVLELGTNHYGEIRQLARVAAPSAGIITNIGPAHLEFFGDERGVLKEKWDLIEELAWPRIAILNADDPLLKEKLSCDIDGAVFTFGIKQRADFMARRIMPKGAKVSFLIKNSPIQLNTPATINVYDALAAYLTARIFSIDAYDILNAFKRFQFPDSRFQIKNINGLQVIDDGYNANPASFYHAINAFSNLKLGGRKIVVIGDMLELGAKAEDLHRKIGKELIKMNVDLIVAIGPLSHIACDAALSRGFNSAAVYKCFSAQEARDVIFGLAKKNDAILIKGSRRMRLEEIFKGAR